MKIVKADGTECRAGEIGDLLVRPPGRRAEVNYFGNPEASAAKVKDGWLRTGDRARRDDDGWLFFVDRADDFIRRRGENISSSEVEAVVNQYPLVLECAAYAIPSDMGDDEVAVAVVLQKPAPLNPAELITFCKGRLAAYQLPRFVRVLAELPKTETHRPQKALLRREGVTSDTWDSATMSGAPQI
jgi:crotonobetaine/carnitine-CoA ligase